METGKEELRKKGKEKRKVKEGGEKDDSGSEIEGRAKWREQKEETKEEGGRKEKGRERRERRQVVGGKNRGERANVIK